MNFFKKIGRITVFFVRDCKWFFCILWKYFKPEIFLTLIFGLFLFVVITMNTVQYNTSKIGIYNRNVKSGSFNVKMSIGDMFHRKYDHETDNVSLRKFKDTVIIEGHITKYRNNELKDFDMYFDINDNDFLKKKLNEHKYTSYIKTEIGTMNNRISYKLNEYQDLYLIKGGKYMVSFRDKEHYTKSIVNNEKLYYPIRFYKILKWKNPLNNMIQIGSITDCYTDNSIIRSSFYHTYEGNLFFSSGILNYLRYKAVVRIAFKAELYNQNSQTKETYENCSISINTNGASDIITNIYPEPDERTAKTIIYNTPEKINHIINDGLAVYTENFTKGNFVTGINNVLNVLLGVIAAIVANNIIGKRHIFRRGRESIS